MKHILYIFYLLSERLRAPCILICGSKRVVKVRAYTTLGEHGKAIPFTVMVATPLTLSKPETAATNLSKLSYSIFLGFHNWMNSLN